MAWLELHTSDFPGKPESPQWVNLDQVCHISFVPLIPNVSPAPYAIVFLPYDGQRGLLTFNRKDLEVLEAYVKDNRLKA